MFVCMNYCRKHQQHHLDLSSSAIESRENIDPPFGKLNWWWSSRRNWCLFVSFFWGFLLIVASGSRMLFTAQELMLRRKLEQEAELQHALELQGRRMMNLQLMDLKNQHHNHHLLQGFRAGIPMSSPRQSQFLMNQNFMAASDGSNQENSEGLFIFLNLWKK